MQGGREGDGAASIADWSSSHGGGVRSPDSSDITMGISGPGLGEIVNLSIGVWKLLLLMQSERGHCVAKFAIIPQWDQDQVMARG